MIRPTCIIYPWSLPTSDIAHLTEVIQNERCTALLGVPTILFDLMQYKRQHECDFKSLQLVILSGAPVSAAFIQRIESELEPPHVVQVYGQTEPGRIATTSFVPTDRPTQRYESMGKCVPRREIKIIDVSSKRIVPLGETGEICTRSFHTMCGYWSNEQKTREVIDNTQWMHTGDLGALDADGCLYFRGRVKDMIIRGGINIFAFDIETCLEQHDAIQKAQVFGIPDERLGEIVCAFVIPKREIDEQELRIFLQKHLAYFKIPKYIRQIDAFPVTINGKIQKFKLSAIMEQILRNEDNMT
ncbi:unnamed protein product [Adineta ricciae]|uniref:Medium-chain acyl-CoA ligase ACSF2, mitochondrial n=1 Tax=Adineta ricciae TaxID=249248 RepID=A0A814MIM4_ADIRI|nr:unnamed protein product [Adineta ricciae]CAF1603380.1 unnamed protein product [Adineta ricciae]